MIDKEDIKVIMILAALAVAISIIDGVLGRRANEGVSPTCVEACTKGGTPIPKCFEVCQ